MSSLRQFSAASFNGSLREDFSKSHPGFMRLVLLFETSGFCSVAQRYNVCILENDTHVHRVFTIVN